MAQPASSRRRRLPRVGDAVGVRFGGRVVRGVVTEHRGPLGVGGREILGVEVDLDPPAYMEFGVDEIEDAPPARRRAS
jgi:hypothetical protein